MILNKVRIRHISIKKFSSHVYESCHSHNQKGQLLRFPQKTDCGLWTADYRLWTTDYRLMLMTSCSQQMDRNKDQNIS